MSCFLVATLQGQPLWGLWKEEQAEEEERGLVGDDEGHRAPRQEVTQGQGGRGAREKEG